MNVFPYYPFKHGNYRKMGRSRLRGFVSFFLFSAAVVLSACSDSLEHDKPEVLVTPTGNLVTTESGGTATFTVSLTVAPGGNVVIDVVSRDITEVTVDTGRLFFTDYNWNIPQTVTVTGIDDIISDGNQTVTVTVDINTTLTVAIVDYEAVNPADVTVTNTDNEIAGVTVTPTTGLTTTEAGGTATFNVLLNTEPDGNVVIDVESLDLTEATVDKPQLTFTPADWATAQTVTVTGVDDDLADGNQTITVTLDINAGATLDTTGYALLDPADVTVTNTDNDTAGVTVNPTSGLITTEDIGTDTFTVVLNTEPVSDVIINVTSSDLTEGTVNPAQPDQPLQLTFTPADWSTVQTVTVTGVNDDITDGNQIYDITVDIDPSTTATGYTAADLNPADVTVTNTDND